MVRADGKIHRLGAERVMSTLEETRAKLAAMGGTNSSAHDLNDVGQIVGYADVP